MKNEAYLVGTYREKKEINRLVETCPSMIYQDFISLCTDLLEYLYIDEVKTMDHVDSVIDDFIDNIEVDITEQLNGPVPELGPYLRNVRRALQFFKYYLDTLDWVPLPPNLHVADCRSNAVMILKIINPRHSI